MTSIRRLNQETPTHRDPRISSFKEMKLALALLHEKLQILSHSLEAVSHKQLGGKEIEHLVHLNQETRQLCHKIETADLEDLTDLQFTLLTHTHKSIIKTLVQACSEKQSEAIDILLRSNEEIEKVCGEQISDILTKTPMTLEQNRKTLQIANLWHQSNHSLEE